jgi:DNA-binding CsgD family transcriptional regulator
VIHQSATDDDQLTPTFRVNEGERLLERDRAIADLHAMLRPIGRSQFGMAIIEGEHGIGKSALLNSICSQRSALGAGVLRARASEQEQGQPLGVVHQILAQLHAAGNLGDESRQRIRRMRIEGTSEEGLLDIYHELDDMLVRHAGDRFVVVAIDDVHFADEPSLGWLRFLAHRLYTIPVAVILTALPPRNVLVQQPLDPIVTEAMARRIELRPLSAAAVTTLVRNRFGAGAVAKQLDVVCFEASRGIPALLFALLDDLGRSAARHDPDRLVELVRHAAPGRVVRSIVHRVASTGPQSLAVLQAIALLDGVADLDDIAEVGEVDPTTVATAVERLTEAGILEAAEPLRFVHPLVRTSLVGAIPPSEARALHTRAARALKQKGRSNALVATHLLETSPTGSALDTDILLTAARQALHDGSPEAASRLLARGESELAYDLMTDQQLLEVAELHARLHHPEAMDLLMRVSQQVHDPERLIPIVFALTDAPGAPDLPEARGLLHRLRARTFESPGVTSIDVALHLLDGPVHRRPLPPPRVSDLPLLRALRAIQSCADPQGATAVGLGGILEQCIDAVHLASPDPVPFQVGHRALIALIRIGRPHLAERLVSNALELLGDDDVALSARLLRLRSVLAVRQGNLALAQSLRDLAAQRWSPSAWGFASIDACWDARLALLQGDATRAAEILTGAEGSEFDMDPYLIPESLGWVALVEGDADAAKDHFASAAELAERCGAHNPAVTSWRAGCARALGKHGDLRSARDVAHQGVDLARTFGAPGPLAIALGGLAAARPENSVELLDEAVIAADQSGEALLSITSRLELGRALRHRGEDQRAVDVLRAAGDLAHHFQSPAISDSVVTQLRACGSRPARLALRGIESLTPAQLRTVQLAAEGATNVEIAAALFISIKTVESHLARAYRKLGVKARTELPALFD